MTLEQLKKIGQLDQLKKDGVLTPEEYDKARERVLAEVEVKPVKTTEIQAHKKQTSSYYIFGGVLIAAILAVILLSPKKPADDFDPKRDYLAEEMKRDSLSTQEAAQKEAIQKEESAKAVAEARATVKKLRPMMRYQKDDFNGGWFNPRSAPKYTNANGIYAYFNYLDDANGPGVLRFRVQYYSDDWLFIERYRFLIDGQEYVYIPDEVSRDSGDGGMIWEWFDEPINGQLQEIMDALIKAKSAKVRFEGKDYRDDKIITPAQRVDFKRVKEMHQALAVLHAS